MNTKLFAAAALGLAGIASSAAASADPLPLRQEKPLVLAPEPARSSWGYKAGFLVVAFSAVGVIAYRRRRPTVKSAGRALTVTSRASVGMRAEVAVVEVDDVRILIGVTPSAIQTLVVLSEASDAETAESESQEKSIATSETTDTIAERAKSLFSPRPSSAPAAHRYAENADEPSTPSPSASEAPSRRPPKPRDIAGQARGIALALGAK
jgi:flagellar biogenesis protein FliO